MFTSILCPIDFSQHSERALRLAVGMASACGAHLTLITVTDPLLDAAARATGSAHRLTEQTQSELRALLSRVHPEGAAGPMAVAVAIGQPAAEILKQANECGADLIVMGMHGAGAAETLLMGSTTARVLHTTRVPVLAVPPLRHA